MIYFGMFKELILPAALKYTMKHAEIKIHGNLTIATLITK